MKTCIPCGSSSDDATCPACGEASWSDVDTTPDAPVALSPVAAVVEVRDADIASAHLVAGEAEPTDENTTPDAPVDAKKGKRR